VQVEEVESPANIFTDYAYFSSFSNTWLEHSASYAKMAVERFGLGANSQVVEIASNDGYLLQYFMQKQIPVLGIEPAANVAITALEKGIPTVVRFFGKETATQLRNEGKSADLLIGNNVLAHVPDLNDFVAGMKVLLKAGGTITMEFPHLMKLMNLVQFDTIYHEHFSYLSLSSAKRIFAAHGLSIYDVEQLPTHGGSLRIYACHESEISKHSQTNVQKLLSEEDAQGLSTIKAYASFEAKVKESKRNILSFLIDAARSGKKVAAFGAPAKGNTLLNYCGVRSDMIAFTVDDTPAKQGRFLPGTHIPVFSAEMIRKEKPDFIVILPWNFKEEIMKKHAYVSEWGCKFVVFIPELKVFN
jgi:SAM-dependent methyltransferase